MAAAPSALLSPVSPCPVLSFNSDSPNPSVQGLLPSGRRVGSRTVSCWLTDFHRRLLVTRPCAWWMQQSRVTVCTVGGSQRTTAWNHTLPGTSCETWIKTYLLIYGETVNVITVWLWKFKDLLSLAHGTCLSNISDDDDDDDDVQLHHLDFYYPLLVCSHFYNKWGIRVH